jgi:hypothetical protein
MALIAYFVMTSSNVASTYFREWNATLLALLMGVKVCEACFLIFWICVLDVLLKVTPVTPYADSFSGPVAGNESGLVQ